MSATDHAEKAIAAIVPRSGGLIFASEISDLIRSACEAAAEEARAEAIAFCCAYVTDRAHQYVPSSGCHDALLTVAWDVGQGEPQRAHEHGELDDLTRFALFRRCALDRIKERVRAEEREACAKVCESHQSEHRAIFECEDGFLNSVTRDIRARGQG